MNQLITLHSQTINGNAIETVSARELHTFLGSKQDFSTWIKNRIEKYGFVENVDYLLHKIVKKVIQAKNTLLRFHKKMEANNATLIEYYVTIEMAKELAMVENHAPQKMERKNQ